MRGKTIKIIILIALLFGLAGLLYAQTTIHPNTGRIERARHITGQESGLPQALPTVINRVAIGTLSRATPYAFLQYASGAVSLTDSGRIMPVYMAMSRPDNDLHYPRTGVGDWRQLMVTTAADHFKRSIVNESVILATSRVRIDRMIVNVAGSASMVSFWSDASVPCDGEFLFRLPTTVTGDNQEINFGWLGPVCMLTEGTAAADITILRSVNQ